jgi:hypothetical protein
MERATSMGTSTSFPEPTEKHSSVTSSLVTQQQLSRRREEVLSTSTGITYCPTLLKKDERPREELGLCAKRKNGRRSQRLASSVSKIKVLLEPKVWTHLY